jgi:Flp pilus assembly protein TadG
VAFRFRFVPAWLRRRFREERGAVLPLVVISMVVFLGMAALAVDLGSLWQQQRQTQAAADAAALAGAQDLPGSPGTATTQAQSYVTQNVSGAGTPVVSQPNSLQIKVTVNKSAPTFFGNTFGLTSENVSATAVAGLTQTPSCSAPGTSCYAIFAMDPTCPSGTGVSITGGAIGVGGILSNGDISTTGGTSDSFGNTTYGPATCKWNDTGGSKTFASGPTHGTGTSGWPIDYAYDFPACTGVACTGPGGTPSFCTLSSTLTSTWSVTPAVNSPQIYCDVGSGTASTPTTWNGAMTVTQGGSSASPQEATYVAGKVTFAGSGYSEACGYAASGYVAAGCATGVPKPPFSSNYPLVYAVSSGAAVTATVGGTTFLGDIFAPAGTISFTGGGSTTGFLEGYDVTFQGGNLTADGPATTKTTFSQFGTVSLMQ